LTVRCTRRSPRNRYSNASRRTNQLLIEAGTNVSTLGGRVLLQAAISGPVSIVELLLARGADPLAEEKYGKTVLANAEEEDISP
jgi:hypothetical protein